MLAKSPADLFGESPLLTRLDLSDEENIKDAAHQLARCRDDFQFAAWARRWGEPLVQRAQDAGPGEALDEATEAANEAEAKFRKLHDVAEAVIKEFDAAAADLPDEPINALNDIIAKLENAL
jgi:hypothetical protein